MSSTANPPPTAHNSALFKGIALFTPGGDLVYCIDPQKQNRWHLQLCTVLQELLGLPEPPHFLVPCYTATVDRWFDPSTQQVRTVAEASPLVLKHQALLNAIFATGDLVWHRISHVEELCDAIVLEVHKNQFPQLWEDHDLIVRFERAEPGRRSPQESLSLLSWTPAGQGPEPQGCVLRLFVAGSNTVTERSLQNLHQLLERSLQQPYTLKVIDIRKHPELAEADQVTATPTLLKVWPPPIKRIVGDLDNVNRILELLVSSRKSF